MRGEGRVSRGGGGYAPYMALSSGLLSRNRLRVRLSRCGGVISLTWENDMLQLSIWCVVPVMQTSLSGTRAHVCGMMEAP